MPSIITLPTDPGAYVPVRPTRSRNRRKVVAAGPALDHRVILARRLDMLAGCELQHGHHLAAEHLARRAQALREARS